VSEAIQEAIRAHPLAAPFIVFLLAWLEYVFPPVPGDSTMLFGCFLAGAGLLPPVTVSAAALLGSVLGAITAYGAGRRLGRSYFFLRTAWARQELERLERGFTRYGARLLAINRFLPGVRGFFLYAAGIGRLGWRPVLVYSTLSNVLWVALIVWAGNSLGESWEQVSVMFRRYVWGIAIVMTIYVGWTVVRMRRRRRLEAAGGRTTS
jgi:membrane protein DedA with SNARE-associated domain